MPIKTLSKIKLIVFALYALPSVTLANPVTVKAAEWTKADNVKQCSEGNCNTFKNITISIDTFWSNTAQECIQYGASIINDISAGEKDKNMFSTITKLNVPYIIMHMKGTPKNMQKNITYTNFHKDIINFFLNFHD